MFRLPGIFLAIASAAALSGLAIVLFGGFETELLGVRIAAHESLRSFVIASIALAIAIAAQGWEGSARTFRHLARSLNPKIISVALALGVGIIGVAFASTVGGGPDPYGYVSQADRWLHRPLRTDVPFADAPWPNAPATWAPLGYVPAQHDGAWWIVPMYSPGLPLLMAAAKGVGGQEAIFWIVPICGGLLVFSSYRIGRQLVSKEVGAMAAWLVATSPVFLVMLVQPMSDIPVAAAWAITFHALLGVSVRSALGAGVASAVAIMIRPNLAPLALVFAAGLFGHALVRSSTARLSMLRSAAFVAGVLPGFLAVAAINSYLHGSPLQSGYGDLSSMFQLSNVIPNAGKYLSWLAESHTPLAVVGLAAVFVPSRRLWPGIADRFLFWLMPCFVVTVWAQYFAFLRFEDWPFLRYLLPSWPLIMAGAASMLALAIRSQRPLVALVAAWAVCAAGAYGLSVAQRAGTFVEWQSARRYVDLAQRVRERTDERSVTLALLHTGSVRYYGGRLTLRYDQLDPAWLDRVVTWLTERGIHVYALLEPWERTEFERRFAGQQSVAALGQPALLSYQGPNVIALYDLTRKTGISEEIQPQSDLSTLRSVPPEWPLSTPHNSVLTDREVHYP